MNLKTPLKLDTAFRVSAETEWRVPVSNSEGRLAMAVHGKSDQDAIEKAVFILRAINHRSSLLSACEGALSVLEKFRANYPYDTSRTMNDAYWQAADAIASIQSAISDADSAKSINLAPSAPSDPEELDMMKL